MRLGVGIWGWDGLHTNVASTEVDGLFRWGVVVCSHVGDWTIVLDLVGDDEKGKSKIFADQR